MPNRESIGRNAARASEWIEQSRTQTERNVREANRELDVQRKFAIDRLDKRAYCGEAQRLNADQPVRRRGPGHVVHP